MRAVEAQLWAVEETRICAFVKPFISCIFAAVVAVVLETRAVEAQLWAVEETRNAICAFVKTGLFLAFSFLHFRGGRGGGSRGARGQWPVAEGVGWGGGLLRGVRGKSVVNI